MGASSFPSDQNVAPKVLPEPRVNWRNSLLQAEHLRICSGPGFMAAPLSSSAAPYHAGAHSGASLSASPSSSVATLDLERPAWPFGQRLPAQRPAVQRRHFVEPLVPSPANPRWLRLPSHLHRHHAPAPFEVQLPEGGAADFPEPSGVGEHSGTPARMRGPLLPDPPLSRPLRGLDAGKAPACSARALRSGGPAGGRRGRGALGPRPEHPSQRADRSRLRGALTPCCKVARFFAVGRFGSSGPIAGGSPRQQTMRAVRVVS
jgi:hypothetical protein